ncbi:MAG: DUF1801 domain-containing protein [Bacteroidota bacterium]
MNAVEAYIIDQPEVQRELLWKLHHLISSIEGVNSHIKYDIPFYEWSKPLCYLNPIKKHAVELAFTRGFELNDPNQVLEARGRKKVKGIQFATLSAIQDSLVLDLVQAAIDLEKNS